MSKSENNVNYNKVFNVLITEIIKIVITEVGIIIIIIIIIAVSIQVRLVKWRARKRKKPSLEQETIQVNTCESTFYWRLQVLHRKRSKMKNKRKGKNSEWDI